MRACSGPEEELILGGWAAWSLGEPSFVRIKCFEPLCNTERKGYTLFPCTALPQQCGDRSLHAPSLPSLTWGCSAVQPARCSALAGCLCKGSSVSLSLALSHSEVVLRRDWAHSPPLSGEQGERLQQ